MRHFLKKYSIFSLYLCETFLHKCILLSLRFQMRSSTRTLIIDTTLHLLKLGIRWNKTNAERRRVSRRTVVSHKIIESRLRVLYLLLVTLLTSLNMSFHASFVLHRHCLSTTVHGGNGVKHKKVERRNNNLL